MEFILVNKIRYPPEVENCWMVEEIGKPAVEKLNEHPSYPTIDEYIERMENKEAEKKELSGNEKYLKNLMSVRTLKPDSKRKPNKVDERTRIEGSKLTESCFSIGVIDSSRSTKAANKEIVREDKKMKVKQKKKSSLNSRPLTEEEMIIKREWNRAVRRSVRAWKLKLIQKLSVQNPP